METNVKFEKVKEGTTNLQGEVILGKLKGPVAQFRVPTRNGTFYSQELWETQFKDPLVLEFFQNGGMPGELDHPEEREETLGKEVAIIMPEVPKKNKDGVLIGEFDILDTPNGRILATLCKYGYKIGISSRGGYDDIAGPEDGKVDPTMYHLKAFDAVLMPSVKVARMEASGLKSKAVNESLQNSKVRNALKESLSGLTGENLQVAKVKLEQLSSKNNVLSPDFLLENIKNEALLEQELDDEELQEENPNITTDEEFDLELDEAPIQDEAEIEVADEEVFNAEGSSEYIDLKNSVADLGLNSMNDYEDGKPILKISMTDQIDKINAVIELLKSRYDYVLTTRSDGTIDSIVVTEELPEQSEDLVESLMTNIEEKTKLEEKIKTLQENNVNIRKSETEKNEEITKLKESLSKISAKAKALDGVKESLSNATKERDILKKLNESLKAEKITLVESNKKLEEQLAKQKDSSTLTESLKMKAADFENEKKTLLERFNTQLAEKDSKLEKTARTLSEQVEMNKVLKAKNSKILEKYIDSKASIFGIKREDVLNRLPKKFSFNEIDRLVESLKGVELQKTKINFVEGISLGKVNVFKPGSELYDQDLEAVFNVLD